MHSKWFRENKITESAIMAAVTHVKKEKAKGRYPVLVSLDTMVLLATFRAISL